MTSLPALLGAVTATLQTTPLVRQMLGIETREFSPDQFYFKVRVELEQRCYLQARIYYNRGHIDYAYQVFQDVPLWRWDDKEEFAHLTSYPHHHHADGQVLPSPLTGDPVQDLALVLREIEKLLA